MSTQNLTAVIFGATGATGKHVLTELLQSSSYSKVHEIGRRVTPIETLENINGREKLIQKTVDFDKISEEVPVFRELKADVVYLALGTTKAKAGSTEAFVKIDREIPVAAAKAARVDGVTQRLVYISSGGASPTSPFLYPKSKGLTEQDLAKLGYTETIIFRPGLLAGADRGERRLAEDIAQVFTGLLSHVTSSVEINVRTLAKSMVNAGTAGAASLKDSVTKTDAVGDVPSYYTLSNAQALALAKDK